MKIRLGMPKEQPKGMPKEQPKDRQPGLTIQEISLSLSNSEEADEEEGSKQQGNERTDAPGDVPVGDKESLAVIEIDPGAKNLSLPPVRPLLNDSPLVDNCGNPCVRAPCNVPTGLDCP